MKYFISVSQLFLALSLFGQDTLSEPGGEIYRKWPQWRMNGQKLNEKQLRDEIYKSPAAIPYYKKAKTNQIIGLSLAAPFIASIVLFKKSEKIFLIKEKPALQ